MSNPVIKFSLEYDKIKLPDGSIAETAILLEVLEVDLKNLSEVFKLYDTHSSNGNYPLSKSGKYLLLIFKKYTSNTNCSDLFTTLRSAKHGKLEYYKSKIGKVFDVEMVEK